MLPRGRARIRARSLTILLGAALAAGTAGCTAASNSAVTVSGKNLTVYANLPAGSDQTAVDVYDAEQLAFQQKHSEVTAFTLTFKKLTATKLSDAARTAIEDLHSVAYLGEIAPGASADTLGITNGQDLLQVSPTDTAVELTQTTAADPGAPNKYYESLGSYGRTFARVVPTTAVEAHAQVQEMQGLQVKQLYVTDDGSPYGRAIAAAVKQDAAPSISVVSSPSGADAAFDGASTPAAGIRTFTSLASSNPRLKLFGPSALYSNSFASGLSTGAANAYISVPGVPRADLPTAGQTFISDFTAAYGHAPGPEAIFGYEAMAAVLDSIKQAGKSANNRSTVVQDFFAIKNRASVLPTYSINANGDTSLGTGAFIFSRIRAGKLVQAQG